MNTPPPSRILVIDDEKGILTLISRMLTRHGIDVHTATSGEEGVTKIISNPYDVILTDLKMPGMSGNQVLEQVRQITGPDLPVVAMSGTPWLAGESEFDGFLAKPFGQNALLETIKSLVPSFHS